MLFLFSLLLILSTPTLASASSSNVRRHAHSTSPNILARGRFYGHGTWYNPGQGACGSHATSNDYVVALNGPQYHQDRLCYKQIRITNTMNGKSVGAEIQDECPDCPYGNLDMSPVVFTAIADSGLGEGEISISWSFTGSSKRTPGSPGLPPSSSTGSLTPRTNITSTTPAFASDADSETPNGGLNPIEARLHGGTPSSGVNEHNAC